ncbi:stage II sporulation protein M [Ruminococcus sp. OA3]|uniref:stage II sporulation protein M n=1 Tax=Ruminococcus sp. OA3 TaxID=2914164 RepID=UPI001F053072|nr:stage II sporulation protein M [Ruminococcus sp. OA3]MCH1983067.1 stage II sporulation protein M [Ruminococcus sp. OA3]
MRRFRLKPDVPVRLFIYLYLGAFLLGILAVNQLWKVDGFRDYVSVYAVLEQYKASYIDMKKYGLFMLREKSLFVGVSILAGIAGAGEILAVLVSLWLGFLAGGLAVLFLLQSGLKGFLFCMAGILSQLIFYIPAVFGFLLLMGKHKRSVQGYPSLSAQESRWPILLCVIFLFCMALGILIETYVNSVLWLKIFT